MVYKFCDFILKAAFIKHWLMFWFFSPAFSFFPQTLHFQMSFIITLTVLTRLHLIQIHMTIQNAIIF